MKKRSKVIVHFKEHGAPSSNPNAHQMIFRNATIGQQDDWSIEVIDGEIETAQVSYLFAKSEIAYIRVSTWEEE